jgi:effector-binding domain-containing protein
MKYKIRVFDLPEQPTLCMRTVTPVENLPEFFGKAFGGVMAHLTKIGEYPSGLPFGAYLNLDMTALEVEAGFPVARDLEGSGEILAGTIPAGKFVSTIHKGAYDSVKFAYDALIAWAKENGYEPSGVAYEYYLNDPGESSAIVPETEVRFLIK